MIAFAFRFISLPISSSFIIFFSSLSSISSLFFSTLDLIEKLFSSFFISILLKFFGIPLIENFSLFCCDKIIGDFFCSGGGMGLGRAPIEIFSTLVSEKIFSFSFFGSRLILNAYHFWAGYYRSNFLVFFRNLNRLFLFAFHL